MNYQINHGLGSVRSASMFALANSVARPMDLRLHTRSQQGRRRCARWVPRGGAGEINEEGLRLPLLIETNPR